MGCVSVQVHAHVCVSVVIRLLRATIGDNRAQGWGTEEEEGGIFLSFSDPLPHINLNVFLCFCFVSAAVFIQHYQQNASVCLSDKRNGERLHAWMFRLRPGGYTWERGRWTDREREREREWGCIPGGIQTASVLCDWDGDDFIRPASFFPLLSLSLPGCK